MQIIGLKGKSAYQYAQDGGYTGTEAEFKNKMAKELEVVYDYEDLNEAILATAIKPEVSGEFIHLIDSAALPIMNFGMEGKTEQKQYSGKNLWANGDVEVTSADNNGVGYKQVNLTNPLPPGTYTLSALVTSTDTDADYSLFGNFYNLKRGGTTRTSTTATFSNEITAIVVYAGSNQANSAGDTATFKDIQIELGSTATEYEPYTGNQPSPNPDYPQEITNAGVLNPKTGRYEIGCKVVNRNLFDLKAENVTPINNSTTNTSVMDIENGVELSYTNIRNSYVILNTKLLPNTTYVISCNIVVEADQTQSTFLKCINVYDNNGDYYNGNIAKVLYTKGKNTLSFTTPSNTDNVKIALVGWALVDNTTGKTTFTDFVLSVEGEEDYIPNASQQITLTSPVPLTKWDKLVKRDGVYGWSTFNKEYNPSEILSVACAGYSSDIIRFAIYDIQGIKNTECYCNLFRYSKDANYTLENICTFAGGDNITCTVSATYLATHGYAYDSELSSGENHNNACTAFKAMLTDKGNIQVWVNMQEEQSFHPLPDEEQELLKGLETYYQVTNIFNDQGCPMSIQYIADTQTYVDNLANSLTNAVVSLGGEV